MRRRSLHDHGGDVTGDFGLLHVLPHVWVVGFWVNLKKKLEKRGKGVKGFLRERKFERERENLIEWAKGRSFIRVGLGLTLGF